jgi:hypothetical protein
LDAVEASALKLADWVVPRARAVTVTRRRFQILAQKLRYGLKGHLSQKAAGVVLDCAAWAPPRVIERQVCAPHCAAARRWVGLGGCWLVGGCRRPPSWRASGPQARQAAMGRRNLFIDAGQWPVAPTTTSTLALSMVSLTHRPVGWGQIEPVRDAAGLCALFA